MVVTAEEIRSLVAEQFDRPAVAEDDRIIEDLAADSLDIVELIATVEERYDITIDESELPEIRTVADLHACVRDRHR